MARNENEKTEDATNRGMTLNEHIALEELVFKNDPIAVAAILRGNQPLSLEARQVLADWITKPKRKTARTSLENAKRDIHIMDAFAYYRRQKGYSYQNAITAVERDLEISSTAIKTALAANKSGELLPDLVSIYKSKPVVSRTKKMPAKMKRKK